jgi:hypothetical protein
MTMGAFKGLGIVAIALAASGCVETNGYPTSSYGGYGYGNSGYYGQPTYYGEPAYYGRPAYHSQPSYYSPPPGVVTQTRYGSVVPPSPPPRRMRDRDGDGIPDKYDRDRNGDGVPDRYQRRNRD